MLDIIARIGDASATMQYPGGKGKTFQHVINLMPPHRVYIETHLGGGAVFRHKKLAERNIGIEVDVRVIERWKEHAPPRLELVHGRAESFLASFEFAGDELVYCDPPFVPSTRRSARVYTHDYSHEDHERLLELLLQLPCKIILSGYDNALYANALPHWHTRTFDAKTHVDVRRETLWFNFAPPAVLHDARFLGDNFRDREVRRRRLQRFQHRLARMDPIERVEVARWLHATYPDTLRNCQ